MLQRALVRLERRGAIGSAGRDERLRRATVERIAAEQRLPPKLDFGHSGGVAEGVGPRCWQEAAVFRPLAWAR
jgi:hypothetical protein